MKNKILFNGLKAVSLGLLAFTVASCDDTIDNFFSKNQSEITITGSGEYIKLDESKPDEIALTIDWSPAHDYGYEYYTTYQYEMSVGSAATAIEEYEDGGVFHREFTNAELQDLLINHFGVATSTAVDVTFTITASFEGPTLKVPDVETKTVKVKTYGPKQFVADNLYMGGTAVGDERIELTKDASDAQLYTYTGHLNAGSINFPVTNFDENNAIGPENPDTPIELSDMPAVITDEAEANFWTVPEADTYRVTVNLREHTVRIVAAGAVVDVDQMFLAGTAVGNDQVEIKQTLENENVYAWRGELKAGTLYLPLTFQGTQDMSIVPATADDNSIHDGSQQSFAQVATSTAAANRNWKIPADGTYRIVVNKEDHTVTIYSAATDLKNKTIIFKRTQAPADDNYTCEIEALWIFGGNKYYNGSKPSDIVLTQSLANPRLFVYKGEALQADKVKFCATNHWNNEYAFGSGSTRDTQVDVTFGQKFQPIYGGQGNNRYAWFNMPEGTNYIEVYIGSEQYDEEGNALSQCWGFEGSYVIFDQK